MGHKNETRLIEVDILPEIDINKLEHIQISVACLNKELGFKIGIDDFGTGYSSMGYIHKLPIDVLKIDRTFVEDVIHNPKTRAIVTAITKLSSSLGITTIAEGIEREEDAASLEELHCNFGQGYLFDEALEVEMFERKYLA